MIDLLLAGLLALSLVVGEFERRRHADEIARLTAAALHRTPEAAAAVLTDTPRPERDHEPRPTPIGL